MPCSGLQAKYMVSWNKGAVDVFAEIVYFYAENMSHTSNYNILKETDKCR